MYFIQILPTNIEQDTKIDHSRSTVRIVLEQNKFSKIVTSNRD